ncbi:MAG: ribonuclease E activity regulator RraA [Parvibaculales bacterium]
MPEFATTDLSDAHASALCYLPPIFHNFGGRVRFHGAVQTLLTFEDNTKLRAAMETPGAGRVLVVDGGGSMNCALFGGNLAKLGAENGWAGVVIHGCVRDCSELAAEHIGIKALASHPKKSQKRDLGSYDVALAFCGITIHSGNYLYADEDGIIIAETKLKLN